MKPSEKSPEMERVLDKLCEEVCGVKRTTSIRSDICVWCKESATDFVDALSRKEFMISGLCQKCQDKVFNEPEEDY